MRAKERRPCDGGYAVMLIRKLASEMTLLVSSRFVYVNLNEFLVDDSSGEKVWCTDQRL